MFLKFKTQELVKASTNILIYEIYHRREHSLGVGNLAEPHKFAVCVLTFLQNMSLLFKKQAGPGKEPSNNPMNI